MKVNLKDKQIPRNANGDPSFTQLMSTETGTAILDIFTSEEVIELVNRCLYQLEYQKSSHQQRQQAERELVQPVKDALKALYPGTSWAKASEEQLTKAMEYVKKMKEINQ